MQSAFFKVAEVIPYEQAVDEMKKAIVKTFGKKGEDIVNMNHKAVDRGGEVEKIEIPAEWKNLEEKEKEEATDDLPDFIKNVAMPIHAQKGDELPVSAFVDRE